MPFIFITSDVVALEKKIGELSKTRDEENELLMFISHYFAKRITRKMTPEQKANFYVKLAAFDTEEQE